MKPYFILICLALAACGGSSDGTPSPAQTRLLAQTSAAPTAAPNVAPTLSVSGRTVRVCHALIGSSVPLCRQGTLPPRFGVIARSTSLSVPMPAAVRAAVRLAAPGSSPLRQVDPDPGDDPPTTGDPHAPPPTAPILMFEADGVHADVGKYDGQVLHVTRIAAPVPADTIIIPWTLPGGYMAFTYSGKLDPSMLRFQGALNAAMDRLQKTGTAGSAAAQGSTKRTSRIMDADHTCDPWDDYCDGSGDQNPPPDDSVPITTPDPDPAPNPDPAPDPDPGMPAPDPGYSLPPVIDPNPVDGTSPTPIDTVSNPCIPSPWVICIYGLKPPPPPLDIPQLPSGPMPWFPQSWCNFLSIFCTAGQQPAPPLTDDERHRQEIRECYDNAVAALEVCRKLRDMGDLTQEQFDTCKRDVFDQVKACDALRVHYGFP